MNKLLILYVHIIWRSITIIPSINIRTKQIKSIKGSTNQNILKLRMPLNLLQVLLSLMCKQQLLWYSLYQLSLVILLNWEVPNGNWVVCTGNSKRPLILWTPLDSSNLLSMVGNCCYRVSVIISKIPNLEGSIIGARGNQVSRPVIPADYIHVRVMGIYDYLSLLWVWVS